MNYLYEHYPEYDCDENGTIYKNGNPITPFKSNKYLQVCLFDADHKKTRDGCTHCGCYEIPKLF